MTTFTLFNVAVRMTTSSEIENAKWIHWINIAYTPISIQRIGTRTFATVLPFRIYKLLADKVSLKL